MGLCWILRGLRRQQQLTDRRSRWLKEKYLQLYYEESCTEPMTADAIRVFGGRDWSMTESVGTLSPTSSGTTRKQRKVTNKKPKSVTNIHALTKVTPATLLCLSLKGIWESFRAAHIVKCLALLFWSRIRACGLRDSLNTGTFAIKKRMKFLFSAKTIRHWISRKSI